MEPVPDTERRGIALVFATLPSSVDDLLDNRALTFLRRALRERLGSVPAPDSRDAFAEAVTRAGKTIDAPVAALADIAERSERSSAWASKYRASLIREHVIEPAGYGLVRCRIPHLLEYIDERVLWHDEPLDHYSQAGRAIGRISPERIYPTHPDCVEAQHRPPRPRKKPASRRARRAWQCHGWGADARGITPCSAGPRRHRRRRRGSARCSARAPWR